MKAESAYLSVVVPCYNDEGGLPELYSRLKPVLENLSARWEIVLVNDGSGDDTWGSIRALHQRDKRVKGINLSRNFGHQVAVSAGLQAADGDAVTVMDSDLQDPPEVIPELVKRWKEGFDIVYAVHQEREGDSYFKSFSSKLFYWLLNKFSSTHIPEQAGDFRLMSRQVVESLDRIEERHRYIRGLTVWMGYRQTSVPYNRAEGVRGGSGYTLRKLLKLAFDAIASFSIVPLRLAFFLGLFLFVASIFGGAVLVGMKIFYGIPYRGWTSIFVSVIFLSGIQLLLLGVVGEYVGRIYEEVKKRPLYFVRDSLGLESKP